MTLKALHYYILKALEINQITTTQAHYLWTHPRTARKWIKIDTGIVL